MTTAKVNRDIILVARTYAVQQLHNALSVPDVSTNDETIEFAVRLVINDLCFGETRDLKVHMDQIRNMTTSRGRLATVGSTSPVLVKLALIVDLATAVALDTSPSFPGEELSNYTELINRMTTPFGGGANPRGATSSSTGTPMDPSITAMLKDIDFLLDTILALPAEPSQWELQKVQSMSDWVHGRLSGTKKISSSSSAATKHLHRAVRLGALVYCRSVQVRKPALQAVKEKEIVELVDAVWKVPLETWDCMLSTLVFILAVVMAAVRERQQHSSTRTMVMAAAVQLAMTDWNTAANALCRVVRLQAWLRGSAQAERGAGLRFDSAYQNKGR
ncbi:hypothetical protein VTI74DRAFT_4278 [Chaetomium olivicolor]